MHLSRSYILLTIFLQSTYKFTKRFAIVIHPWSEVGPLVLMNDEVHPRCMWWLCKVDTFFKSDRKDLLFAGLGEAQFTGAILRINILVGDDGNQTLAMVYATPDTTNPLSAYVYEMVTRRQGVKCAVVLGCMNTVTGLWKLYALY